MTTAQSNGNIRIEWNKTLAAIEGSEVMSHPDDVIKVISKGGTFDETKPAGRAPRCEDTLPKRGITTSRDEQERRNVFQPASSASCGPVSAAVSTFLLLDLSVNHGSFLELDPGDEGTLTKMN